MVNNNNEHIYSVYYMVNTILFSWRNIKIECMQICLKFTIKIDDSVYCARNALRTVSISVFPLRQRTSKSSVHLILGWWCVICGEICVQYNLCDNFSWAKQMHITRKQLIDQWDVHIPWPMGSPYSMKTAFRRHDFNLKLVCRCSLCSFISDVVSKWCNH